MKVGRGYDSSQGKTALAAVDRRRSLAPLFALSGFHFVSLAKGEPLTP